MELQCRLHGIRTKVLLGQEITKKDECLYLLYCDSVQEIREFKGALEFNKKYKKDFIRYE